MKTLIEGNKTVDEAIRIARNVVDKLLILKGSSSSLSKSLGTELNAGSPPNLLSIKCLDFVILKSSFLLKVELITEQDNPTIKKIGRASCRERV